MWHPVTVTLAWKWLYREWPDFKEFVCIIIHDWGYARVREMDTDEDTSHPYLGAEIALALFGPKYGHLVSGHSRFLAERDGFETSDLCWADKASIKFDPEWFYLLRARLSGELKVYRVMGARYGYCFLDESDEVWYRRFREYVLNVAREGAQV